MNALPEPNRLSVGKGGRAGRRARNLAVIADKIDVNYRYMAISIKPGRDSASARHKPLFAILPWSRDFLFH
jgi:hypothetical protein